MHNAKCRKGLSKQAIELAKKITREAGDFLVILLLVLLLEDFQHSFLRTVDYPKTDIKPAIPNIVKLFGVIFIKLG